MRCRPKSSASGTLPQQYSPTKEFSNKIALLRLGYIFGQSQLLIHTIQSDNSLSGYPSSWLPRKLKFVIAEVLRKSPRFPRVTLVPLM